MTDIQTVSIRSVTCELNLCNLINAIHSKYLDLMIIVQAESPPKCREWRTKRRRGYARVRINRL